MKLAVEDDCSDYHFYYECYGNKGVCASQCDNRLERPRNQSTNGSHVTLDYGLVAGVTVVPSRGLRAMSRLPEHIFNIVSASTNEQSIGSAPRGTHTRVDSFGELELQVLA